MNYLKRIVGRMLSVVAGGLMALPGLAGCNPFKEYPKNIREFPEPWQTLEPGKPQDEAPRVEIVTQGQGPVVEPGDLVQLQVTELLDRAGRQHDYGYWWLWIGFRSGKETPFFGMAPTVATGLIGLQQGTSLKFLDPSGDSMDIAIFAGELRPNPLGDPKYYSWRKNTTDSVRLSIPTASDYSVITIKRVCKGKLQYRTVRLFDDSPVKVGQGFQTWTSHEPREMWINEAQIMAPCADGTTAVFQYGPLPASGKEVRVVVTGYFDKWFDDTWRKIPEGVQFQNNRAPTAVDITVNTKVEKPVEIDFMANAKDPDGDPLTIWIVKPPSKGTLTTGNNGKFIYTPNKDFTGGGDGFAYKASDGLVESDSANVRIYVEATR